MPDPPAGEKSLENGTSPALARGLRIGLLGGSFNPAHRGHVEVTDAAYRALSLDRFWWLVSPQNPLKHPEQYLPFDTRFAHAKALVGSRPFLHVSDFERRHQLVYTVDTIAELNIRFPDTDFVFTMGADSFAGFHEWRDWRRIAETLPICVVSRPGYDLAALTSVAARALQRHRIRPRAARTLPGQIPPSWVFLPTVHNPISATALRADPQGLKIWRD